MDGGNINAAYAKDNDEETSDDAEPNDADNGSTLDSVLEDTGRAREKCGEREANSRNGEYLESKRNGFGDFSNGNNSKKIEAEVSNRESKRNLKRRLSIGKGFIVRLCLVAGNAVAVWRTVTDTGELWPWALTAICVGVMGAENLLVIRRTGGREWTWWVTGIGIFLIFHSSRLDFNS